MKPQNGQRVIEHLVRHQMFYCYFNREMQRINIEDNNHYTENHALSLRLVQCQMTIDDRRRRPRWLGIIKAALTRRAVNLWRYWIAWTRCKRPSCKTIDTLVEHYTYRWTVEHGHECASDQCSTALPKIRNEVLK